MLGSALSRSRSLSATCSTTSFSRSPLGPTAPGSSPPWPGSSATMISRSVVRGAGAGAGTGGEGGAPATTGGAGRGGVGTPGLDAACWSTLPMNSPSESLIADAARSLAATPASVWRSSARFSLISASSGSRSTRRVEVEHQPVAVGRHRVEREELRRDRLLQVDHQPHHARLVLADAHAGDVRVVGPHLADQFAQLRAQLEPVDVDHQPARVVGLEVLGRQARCPIRASRGCSPRPATRAPRARVAPQASSPAPSSSTSAAASRRGRCGPAPGGDRVAPARSQRQRPAAGLEQCAAALGERACGRPAAPRRRRHRCRCADRAAAAAGRRSRATRPASGRARRRRRESRRRATRAGRRSGRSRSARPIAARLARRATRAVRAPRRSGS